MSLLAASLAIVLFFSDFSASQGPNASVGSWPNCYDTWNWSFNSLGQDPCEVTAYMFQTCFPASAFTLEPLPSGNVYTGGNSPCACSTVGYSLMSACGGCQEHQWLSWPDYTKNCTSLLPPSSFPNPIPSGIYVPHWALLDVTTDNGTTWDYVASHAAGVNPEIGSGTILGPSGPSQAISSSSTSSKATTTTAASNTTTPVPLNPATPSIIIVRGHSSSAGAIVGGIVGGIAAISILVATLFFCRRRSMVKSAGVASDPRMNSDQVQWPMLGQETATTLPETNTPLMKPYNPDDPTTFPMMAPYVPGQESSNKTLYTFAKPPAQEYHGLPIL